MKMIPDGLLVFAGSFFLIYALIAIIRGKVRYAGKHYYDRKSHPIVFWLIVLFKNVLVGGLLIGWGYLGTEDTVLALRDFNENLGKPIWDILIILIGVILSLSVLIGVVRGQISHSGGFTKRSENSFKFWTTVVIYAFGAVICLNLGWFGLYELIDVIKSSLGTE